MPCSAPCSRLPCDERCTKLLTCGHRCPSICGEICPEDLCKDCGKAQDARVDLLEMKMYAEIDIDQSPIVVLGCGHFFTAETLDGMMGMSTVYLSNNDGRFIALADFPSAFSTMPQCPDCKRPVRQYATRRYNRIINRAVADESAKRFLVAGKNELKNFSIEIERLEEKLTASHSDILREIDILHESRRMAVRPHFRNRWAACEKLRREISLFCKSSADRNHPFHKLHEATIHALRRLESDDLSDGLAALSLESPSHRFERDRRVMLTAEMALLKIEFVILEDIMGISRALRHAAIAEPEYWPGGSPLLRAKPFLRSCTSFISGCSTQSLPRLAVEATLCHARMAQMFQSCLPLDEADMAKAIGFVADAKAHLDRASLWCEQPFEHADELKEAVQEAIELINRERYEEVSPEEVAAIKRAMVGGPTGLATHSGHWYNCVNGHPFAIGECGMPMEEARCPECGAAIGGLNHQSVAGVTRAENMED
ncbi:hypothetical protein NQ176_g5227 [Zarea fungicola]|uniref:Uncharacterized protein n=1 Tax=Zarea fungicola TaxID=93591 RepID=A0ACC1NBF2_9HYPO|nr:hypothetical protein NQ176_g5227 [Lecanicillium fungicola]